MPINRSAPPFLYVLASLALGLGLLWWLQSILVPIALAVLVTFLLSPPVFWLQRHGLPRAMAVGLMIAGSLAIGCSIAWSVAVQLNRLVDDFPDYQQHLDAKIAVVHSDGHGFFDKVQTIVARVSTQLDKAARARSGVRRAPVPGDGRPQPVTVVEDDGPFHVGAVWRTINPLLEPLATGGLTLVLVIFMLLRREDLRDRVIAVFGRARLVATTKAFDDAGTRISRYLLRQLIVNCGFGIALGVGLSLIGVPYAILWGALAALLRYVPYLGIWMAAIMPMALSLVLTDGWQPVLSVGGLFLALELGANVLIEPRFYGQGVGVSETGTLVMVTFWTWLWGPAGLLLATPLTVCVVVLGKYVPAFRPLGMLLGDRPALAPEVGFYQRLLAGDEHEALLIARSAAQDGRPSLAALDALVRPALGYLQRDVGNGQLTGPEERAALDVCEQVVGRVLDERAKAADAAPVPAVPDSTVPAPVLVLPTRDPVSATAAKLFAQALDPRRHAVSLVPAGTLASEVGRHVAEAGALAAVVGVVSLNALPYARLLCMRLRAAEPAMVIIVGCWTLAQDVGEDESWRERLTAAGADMVVDTYDEARAHLDGVRPQGATGG